MNDFNFSEAHQILPWIQALAFVTLLLVAVPPRLERARFVSVVVTVGVLLVQTAYAVAIVVGSTLHVSFPLILNLSFVWFLGVPMFTTGAMLYLTNKHLPPHEKIGGGNQNDTTIASRGEHDLALQLRLPVEDADHKAENQTGVKDATVESGVAHP